MPVQYNNLEPESDLLQDAVYKRLEGLLRKRIGSGQWATGTMLPSRRALAKEFGVSLRTVERAVSSLLSDGTLHANGGRGTFVAAPPVPPETELAPAASPLLLRSPERGPTVFRDLAGATLGIIGQYLLDSAEDARSWGPILTQSLERAFHDFGGECHILNRNRGNGRPALPWADAITTLRQSGANALIIIGIFLPEETLREVHSAIAMFRGPVVVITWRDFDWPVSRVFYDNRTAGFQATEHLLQRGYDRILFISPVDTPWAKERQQGVESAAQLYGVSSEKVSILGESGDEGVNADINLARERSYQMAARAFAGLSPGTGVVAVNDRCAVGVLQAVRDRGWEPGRDIGIIGFDDDLIAGIEGLSSLRPPLEAMGQEAARLCAQALLGLPMNASVSLHSRVIPRRSTRR